MIIKIKPLSVNDAWKGKRYKTKQYKYYEQELLLKLRPMIIPNGLLKITVIWGFSSAGSDTDNPIKPLLDILQKRYGFNDSRVKKIDLESTSVKKGLEFIFLEIEQYRETEVLRSIISALDLE